ncbi:MAG TPA: oligosaccharide flippase family protein [Anaerolineales bacterium]|nr:oligosaccharide flippase family protein [Anaerolineales bacterium]
MADPMSLIQKIRIRLQDDPVLQRVVRNSSYLFSSSALSAILSTIQMILVVRLLDPDEYGLATGIIMLFATSVNQLLSFRMSEVVVRYAGEALAHENKERAAAVIKGIGLTEAATSVVAYLVLVALAPWAAATFAKDPATAPLFPLYGLFLLANVVYETSLGTLQTVNRFGRVARANFFQSITTFLFVIAAAVLGLGILGVLLAYLAGKTIAGLMITISALRAARQELGTGWLRAPLNQVPGWRSIGRFMLSTNLNGTVNLLARDNIPIYIGYFLSTTEVGYFKFALTLINLVKVPIEPFIWPTYAEITRTIAKKQWDVTRRLLRQVSSIAGIWTLLTGGGLIALGWWLIPLIFGADYAPSYPALVILMLGYACANILNWNRPLLLALGRPRIPLVVGAAAGVVELILFFTFVPRTNYLVAAAIFSGYLAVSVLWMVWRGLALLPKESS